MTHATVLGSSIGGSGLLSYVTRRDRPDGSEDSPGIGSPGDTVGARWVSHATVLKSSIGDSGIIAYVTRRDRPGVSEFTPEGSLQGDIVGALPAF